VSLVWWQSSAVVQGNRVGLVCWRAVQGNRVGGRQHATADVVVQELNRVGLAWWQQCASGRVVQELWTVGLVWWQSSALVQGNRVGWRQHANADVVQELNRAVGDSVTAVVWCRETGWV
jgi:hypothetical protein